MKPINMILAVTVVTLALTSPLYAAEKQACDNTVNVKVNGLVCDFCARSIEKLFGERKEVSAIRVNLDAGKVDFDLKPGQTLDDATINTLMKDSGFDVTNIHRGCT